MNVSYEDYIERIQKYAARDGMADIRLAREEFHQKTGEFEEDEPWFELRMRMFHDWYLMDRPGSGGLTPVERFRIVFDGSHTDWEKNLLKHMTVTHRSAFKLIKLKDQKLLLDDLIYGGRWFVHWTPPTLGLHKGDILDARIVYLDDRPTAGRSTVLHPREANESVEAIIKRSIREKMPKRELVDHLDKMKLKLEKYSNVKIRHVYQYPKDALL